MKKVVKVVLAGISIVFVLILGLIMYFFIATSSVRLDENKMVDMHRIVAYYDVNGKEFAKEINGNDISELDNIPDHTKKAFIAIEDKRFYSHNGIDIKGILRALLNNLKSFSFKEGASTISQQLIKNTHLTNEKTLNRKMAEIKLALELEKNFSKDEIMEKYLNTIYFGENCYGIACASRHYFNKTTKELDVNESAMLAGIIKAPSTYSPFVNYEKCFERKNLVLNEMRLQNFITESECEQLKRTQINLYRQDEVQFEYDYLSIARKEVDKILQNCPYKYKNLNVYTAYNPANQETLKNNLIENSVGTDCSGVIMDKNGCVSAYFSTCGNVNRQMGSVIKPILVYAPAIENNVVTPVSILNDEKTDFNGYSPSNYNDKYYGNVSVKFSLAKSLNSCAVKLLNYTGIEKSLSYAKKTQIPFSETDNSLCLALGATQDGATLLQITSAYTVFNNYGNFSPAKFVTEIKNDNGEIVYKCMNRPVKIFNNDTIVVMNDMLGYAVTDGTAKKMSYCNVPLCAKTGTVGTKNGNLDAYNISYNGEHVVGIWYGNKDNSLMRNDITGGGVPTKVACEIWDNMYKNNQNIKSLDINDSGVCEIYIDKLSYDEGNKIILADDIAPERYKYKVLMKKSTIPKERSNRFSEPKTENQEMSVNNNNIEIRLCLKEYCKARIYRENNGYKKLVYDTNVGNCNIFYDKLIEDGSYTYSIIPYYMDNEKIYYGKEIVLNTVKVTKSQNLDNKWWKNDLD